MNSAQSFRPSPIVAVYRRLESMNPNWRVEIGVPSGDGWLAGRDLEDASSDSFNAILRRIAERGQTSDRRSIAASFLLRFGWSSVCAIGPYLLHDCVPDIGIENVSIRFNGDAFFERVALHRPSGAMLQTETPEPHPFIESLEGREALRSRLRDGLIRQAQPVVEALHRWSCLSVKAMWGLLASSWGGQFLNVLGSSEPDHKVDCVRLFFEGADIVARVQPYVYAVTVDDFTRVYYRAAACCRYYLLPNKNYCAMCPLISQQERVQRNIDWMKRRLKE